MGSPVVIASPRKSPSSGRRTNKPLVEKKRRARINGCLGQLKSLILNAMQTEGAQVSRLEKADILEMTVKYLRHIQRQQISATMTSEPEVMAKFSAGYTECATEVIRYMDSVSCVTPEVRSRLENHLVKRLRGSIPAEPAVSEGTSTLSETSTSSHSQRSSSSAFSSQISSTTSSEEEMSRHYQTAVDLANMAAAVTAKEAVASATASTPSDDEDDTRQAYEASLSNCPAAMNGHRATESGPDVSRSQSLSPASMCLHSNGGSVTATTSSSAELDPGTETRRRHSSSDASLSSTSSSSSSSNSSLSTMPLPDPGHRDLYNENQDENDYPHHPHHQHQQHNHHYNNTRIPTVPNANNNNNCYHQSAMNNNSNNTYPSTLLRPLHIHIPDSPTPPTTPSPPLPHPHMTYIQFQGHHIPTSAAVATTTGGVVRGAVEDAPPTILYGVEGFHSMPHHASRIPAEMQEEDCSRRATPHSNAIPVCESTPDTQIRGNENYYGGSKYFDDNNNSNHNKDYSNNQNRDDHHGFCLAKGRNTDIVKHTNERYHTLPHVELPPTPSPPTAMTEESYREQMMDRQEQLHYHHHHHHHQQRLQQHSLRYNNSYLNLTQEERMVYNLCANGDFATSSSDYENHYQRQAEYEYRCQQVQNTGIELHRLYRQRDHAKNPQQQPPCNHPSNSVRPGRECPVEQGPHTSAPHHNGLTHMNGPSPHPRVPARQNDTSLSPPTLKRRLLFAQGSEGDRSAAPGCSDGHSDKRRSLAHDDVRLSDGSSSRLQTPQVWRAGREAQTGLCRDVHRSAFPAAIVCASRAHAVSSDESLWRPW